MLASLRHKLRLAERPFSSYIDLDCALQTTIESFEKTEVLPWPYNKGWCARPTQCVDMQGSTDLSCISNPVTILGSRSVPSHTG